MTFKCNDCGCEGPVAELSEVHEISDNLEACDAVQECPACGSVDLVVFTEGQVVRDLYLVHGVAFNSLSEAPALRSLIRPCWPKEQHKTKAAAEAQLRSITKRDLQKNGSLHAYRCDCVHPDTGTSAWHVGHRGGRP